MSSNVGGFLVLGVAAGVGALAYKAFSKDDKKTSGGTTGGLPSMDEDYCDSALSSLPKVFSDMLKSPSTDLGDPTVIDTIADQLDDAGYKQQAACLRKFKPDIVKENTPDDGDVAVGCSNLIDSIPGMTADQKTNIRNAIKLGSAEQLNSLASAIRPINAMLANCIEKVAMTKDTVPMSPGSSPESVAGGGGSSVMGSPGAMSGTPGFTAKPLGAFGL